MQRSPFLLIVLAAVLTACAADSPAGLTDTSFAAAQINSSDICLAVGAAPVFEFDTGTAEGIAVSWNGDVFFGNFNTGEIWSAPHGDFGSVMLLADLIESDDPLSFVLGMDAAPNGDLYVAVNAFFKPDVHGVWRVEPDGTASRAAEAPPFFASLLNDVAIDNSGNVYVSESLGGAIWRITPEGEFHEWMRSPVLGGPIHPAFGVPFGVNGLAYHNHALYAGIHLNGHVVRVPIAHDGNPGEPSLIIADAALVGNDGLEVDAQGNIYIANNFAGTVQRINARDLSIATIVDQGLSAPASLALSSNRKRIYVANLSTSAPTPQPYAPAVVVAEFAVTTSAACRGKGT